MNYGLIINHVLNAQDRLIAKPVVIHHKGVAGVKCIDFKRGVIFFSHFFIRENHAEGSTTDMEPVSQFLVLCGLFLRKDIFIEKVDCFGNVTLTTGNVL